MQAGGGELLFLNRFLHANPAVSFVERMAAPPRFLGFGPTLIPEGLIAEANLEVTEKLPVNAFSYWDLLRARNNKHSWQRRAV